MSPDTQTGAPNPENIHPPTLDRPIEEITGYLTQPITDPNFELNPAKQLQLLRLGAQLSGDGLPYSNHMALEWIWQHPETVEEPKKSSVGNPLTFVSNLINEGAHFADTVEPSDFDSFESFTSAVVAELDGRYRQSMVFNRFNNLLETAQKPDQLKTAADVYVSLMANAKEFKHPGGEGPPTPRHFVIKALRKAGELCTNPTDGQASTKEIAKIIEPVVMTLLEDQHLQKRHKPGLGGRGVNLTGDIAQAQKSFSPGTAEHVGFAVLAKNLASLGYETVYSPFLRKQNYRTAERYITSGTLDYLFERKICTSHRLIDRDKAVTEIVQNIRSTVSELAGEGDRIALMIEGAYMKLRAPGSGKGFAALSRETPLTATIKIANSITPLLNQMPEIKQSGETEEPLERLDFQDLSNLPMAFERILYAINPNLLKEAREGSVAGGSVLRLRMIYIEALAQQWSDYHQQHGLDVGSFVLNSLASGQKPGQVAKELERHLNSQRPDDKATKTMRGIQGSSNVSSNQAYFNRRKPGSGVIS